MKKFIFCLLFLMLPLAISGCKKQAQPEVTQPEIETGQGVNLEPSEARDLELKEIVSQDVRGSLEAQLPAESIAKVDANFDQVTAVDTDSWYNYQNDNYGFSFYNVSGYGINDSTYGLIDVGSEEGAGHFFTINIMEASASTLHEANMKKTGSVVINGQTFTIEEYDDGYAKQISYFTEHKGNEIKITMYFMEGLEEYVDLFNTTVNTFKFY